MKSLYYILVCTGALLSAPPCSYAETATIYAPDLTKSDLSARAETCESNDAQATANCLAAYDLPSAIRDQFRQMTPEQKLKAKEILIETLSY